MILRIVWGIFYLVVMLWIAGMEAWFIWNKPPMWSLWGLMAYAFWTWPLWWPGAIRTIKRWKAGS